MRVPIPPLRRTAGAAAGLVSHAAGEVALAALDVLLASRATDKAIKRISVHVIESPELERLMARSLESPAIERLVAAAVDNPATERLIAATVDSPATERLIAAAVDNPATERLIAAAVDNPATERLVMRVIDSRLLDEIVTRLLEREELWLAVEEIARSPAVTEAITQQSLGFADQVAAGVRQGSTGADAWLERAARRVLRPRRGGEGPAGGPAEVPAQ